MSDTYYNPLDLVELAVTPANPPAGFRRVYSKADGKLYQKTSGGVETQLDNVAGGGSAYTVVSVTTTTYTATATTGQNIILVNTTTAGANVTITIPTAVANTAYYQIKKLDTSTFTITIMPTTSTIEGATTAVILVGGASVDIVSNGTNWYIV